MMNKEARLAGVSGRCRRVICGILGAFLTIAAVAQDAAEKLRQELSDAKALLARWEKVQGLNRASEEIHPRDSAHEMRIGDATDITKFRYVDNGARGYRAIVEAADGARFAEIALRPSEYWFISSKRGLGRLPGPSALYDAMRSSRPDMNHVRKTYSESRRLPDHTREGKTFNIVRMLRFDGGTDFWWLDPEAGTLTQIDSMTGGRLVGRTRFGDFRSIDGFMEPFEIVSGDGEKRTTVKTIHLNNKVALPPGFFDLTKEEQTRWRSTEDVLAKYVKASGGVLALAQIVSRVTKSVAENTVAGAKFEMTISQKAPSFFLIETNVPGVGRSWQGYDGATGWELSELAGARKLRGQELDLFRRNGLLNVENFPKIFPLRRILGVQILNGRKVAVMELGDLKLNAGVHLFDMESGQLVRVESTLNLGAEGTLPVTIDFSDFRTVDGVTLPFKTEMTNPAVRIVTTVESVQQNVEIDDAIFRPRKLE